MIEIKRKKLQTEGQPAAQKPADGLETQAKGIRAPGTEPGLKREIKPFTGVDTTRDYRAMYRKAFEYHEQHNPPTVDIEYWKSHSPGIDEAPPVELDYWKKAIEDMAATANSIQQDPFLTNLLVAIFEELEMEYKTLRDGATAG